MDILLLIQLLFLIAFVILYRLLFDNGEDYLINILPEMLGLYFTYVIMTYIITRNKQKVEQTRTTHLYRQIRREAIPIISNLRNIIGYLEKQDSKLIMSQTAKENINRVKIIIPLLIAGNDLFSEYFYATLFRVIRDIESKMLLITEPIFGGTSIYCEDEIQSFKLSHDELANMFMNNDYEDSPEVFELFQDEHR